MKVKIQRISCERKGRKLAYYTANKMADDLGDYEYETKIVDGTNGIEDYMMATETDWCDSFDEAKNQKLTTWGKRKWWFERVIVVSDDDETSYMCPKCNINVGDYVNYVNGEFITL